MATMANPDGTFEPPASAIPGADAAALLRLEQALEVIGAQCAVIGLRLLRGHPPRRRA